MTQTILYTTMQHTAGLNPKTYRFVHILSSLQSFVYFLMSLFSTMIKTNVMYIVIQMLMYLNIRFLSFDHTYKPWDCKG